MVKRKKSIRRLEGQVVRIELGDGTHSYGRVLGEPLFAFYDELYRDNQEPAIEEIIKLPIAFKVWVMNYAVTKGVWPVIGRVPLAPDEKIVPRFFKRDVLSGELSIYQSIPELAPTYEQPATLDECRGLEQASVWGPEHIEERLRDHFAGRDSRWVEAPRNVDKGR